MNSAKIVEAFGKFVAEIDGQIVTFDTLSEAKTAVVLEEQAEGMASRAAAYCEDRGLVEKNAVAKTRIITDFLAFEATLDTEEDSE
jgi:hypothetical protein